jgi:hypothetical protein
MADSAGKIDETYGIKEPAAQTVARDGEAPVSVLEDGSLDPVYEAKAKMLNKAVQDIGMGRYQWQVSVIIMLQIYSISTFYPKHLDPTPIICLYPSKSITLTPPSYSS